MVAWQNAPSSPTSTDQYLYDGEGNRVAQQVTSGSTTTTTVYVGALETVTTTGSTTPTTTTTTYYYAAGQRIALAVNGTLSYLASDLLGSATVALNASGLPTASQLYAPYGTTRYQNGTMPTDYGFTGQRADSATGLNYYGARYYDPALGQFTSADTVADGLNRYGYVGGNPETFTDPTGHKLNCEVGCGTAVTVKPSSPTSTGCRSDGSCGCYTRCGSSSGNGIGGQGDKSGNTSQTCDQACQDNQNKGMWDVITGIAGLAILAGGIAGACFAPISIACGVAWKALAPLIMQSIHAILDGVDLLHQSSGGAVGDTTSLIIRGAKVLVDVLQAILSVSDIMDAVKGFSKVASAVTGIGQAVSDAEEAGSYAYKIAHASSPEQARAFRAAQTRATNRAVNGFVEGIGGLAGGILGFQNTGNDVIDFQTTLAAWSTANGV